MTGRAGQPTGSAQATRCDILARWRQTAEAWRLTRGEAAALLRLRRSDIVGAEPRVDVSAPIARVAQLVELGDALVETTGSPALASRWIRFPAASDPGRRRLDLITASDDFLHAALRILRRRRI